MRASATVCARSSRPRTSSSNRWSRAGSPPGVSPTPICGRAIRHPYAPHRYVRTRDGLVAGGLGGNPRMWEALIGWMRETGGAADLGEPRWNDEKLRLAEREHVFAVIEAFTRGFAKADFFQAAQRRRLPWAPVDRPCDVHENPQLAARQFFVETAMSDGRVLRDAGFAFGFPHGRRPGRLAVPAPGDANDVVFA